MLRRCRCCPEPVGTSSKLNGPLCTWSSQGFVVHNGPGCFDRVPTDSAGHRRSSNRAVELRTPTCSLYSLKAYCRLWLLSYCSRPDRIFMLTCSRLFSKEFKCCRIHGMAAPDLFEGSLLLQSVQEEQAIISVLVRHPSSVEDFPSNCISLPCCPTAMAVLCLIADSKLTNRCMSASHCACCGTCWCYCAISCEAKIQ